MKNKKGFTLIELVVIIVLLGVIMVFALPNITSTLERNKKDKMILDAQDMVEKYKNYVLSQGLYSQFDAILSEDLNVEDDNYAEMFMFKNLMDCSFENAGSDSLVDSFLGVTEATDPNAENYKMAAAIKGAMPGYLVVEDYTNDDKKDYKNALQTMLSIPLGTLDKRGEIIDSPFGHKYKLGKDDYIPHKHNLFGFMDEEEENKIKLNEIHTDKDVSYVYMCINDNKTIDYKVCLTDGETYTLKADISELNGDDKYTKITTGNTDNSCDIDQKIE